MARRAVVRVDSRARRRCARAEVSERECVRVVEQCVAMGCVDWKRAFMSGGEEASVLRSERLLRSQC